MTTPRAQRISVALCTFNGARYLSAQLESILRQTEPPHEVIVCDDGSTDDTVTVVRRFAAAATRGPKIELHVNVERLSVVPNFEQAYRLTQGDVTFFCDQDDVWMPHKIEKTMEVFRANAGISVVYSDAMLTDSALKPTGSTLFQLRRKLEMGADRDAKQLVAGIGVLGCTLAVHARMKPYVLPIVEGWAHDLSIPFIAGALGGLRPISEPLIYYRRHGGNVSIFDRNPVQNLLAGVHATGPEVVATERRRWESMTARLHALQSASLPSSCDRARLSAFVAECERAVAFGQEREQLSRMSRRARLKRAAKSLAMGDYHRYRRGWLSFLKDLAATQQETDAGQHDQVPPAPGG